VTAVNRPHWNKRTHPTEKPVEALRVFVRHCSPPGGAVLDPFAGSGSAGEAALIEGRRFVGFELKEPHAANARKRCSPAAS
jgi:site-specific DNA-methyltransferase (adenine-specific)